MVEKKGSTRAYSEHRTAILEWMERQRARFAAGEMRECVIDPGELEAIRNEVKNEIELEYSAKYPRIVGKSRQYDH